MKTFLTLVLVFSALNANADPLPHGCYPNIGHTVNKGPLMKCAGKLKKALEWEYQHDNSAQSHKEYRIQDIKTSPCVLKGEQLFFVLLRSSKNLHYIVKSYSLDANDCSDIRDTNSTNSIEEFLNSESGPQEGNS